MIYGLSDLHLDVTGAKDMSVFGRAWDGYETKIFTHWNETVGENDTVLIPGDISWAMSLSEARGDLIRIDELPGRKILLRGNHDYWWQSLNKIKNEGYRTLAFLQNDAYVAEGVRIAGTRGWNSPDFSEFTESDEKIYRRELARLELSLSHKLAEPYEHTICMLHYPPFLKDGSLNDIGRLAVSNDVDLCIYGHLHSDGLRQVREGEFDGVRFLCLSGDYIDFQPQLLYDGERIVGKERDNDYAGNRG